MTGGNVLPGSRELRRGGTAIGPVLPRAHQKRVLFVVAPHDGRVMWTCTINHLCLWCALTGIFLGEVSRRDMPGGISDVRDVRDKVVPAQVQKVYQDAAKISGKKVRVRACVQGVVGA